MAETAPAPESPKMGKSEAWFVEIDAALKREKTWRERGKKIVRRYRDERQIATGTTVGDSKINILWANTEILRAALYSRTAQPDVRRRFPDAKPGNNVSRIVAEIIERGLAYCADAYDSDTPIASSVEDMLLPGRGVVWVVYDPEIKGEEGQETIGHQELREEWVYWEDFCHGHSRSWAKVPWVARRVPMRKGEFEEKFPDAKADKVQATYSMDDSSSEGERGSTESDKFVEVWEVWNKGTKRRIYVGRGYSDILQEDDDPLGLRDFFPLARPLYSVTSTDTLIPVPEYAQYQDQAIELDLISTRITKLMEQLKVRGIYDGSVDGENVLQTIPTLDDGQFAPYRNWAALKEKGGIDAALGFWPLEMIILTLKELRVQQAALIQQIFEITGISDIVRGSTDPRETKGAQQLKAQFGSMRIQRRQKEVQRFIRDTYRIKAEIIAEHFTVETLGAVSGVELPTAEQKQQAEMALQMMQQQAQMQGGGMPGQPPAPPPEPPKELVAMLQSPTWEDVLEVMRSDKLRGYRVDIETDSTVMVDAEAEKASRVEFMEAFVPLMTGAVQAAQVAPQTLPLLKEAVLFAIRTFKAGRSMEQAVEDTFQQLAENPPPNPAQGEAGGDGGAAAMADVQRKAERDKAEIAMAGAKTQADVESTKAETQREGVRLAFDIKQGQAEMALRGQEAEQSAELAAKTAQQNFQIKRTAANRPAPSRQ